MLETGLKWIKMKGYFALEGSAPDLHIAVCMLQARHAGGHVCTYFYGHAVH